MDKGITSFLQEHAAEKPVSFHMPGHKGSRIYKEHGYGNFLGSIMDCDITEIPGADNLFQAESVIAETMEEYRRLYEVKKSYLLVNGSSAGILASILASVGRGGKLVMARNCHKSAFNALVPGEIQPVYVYPEIIEEYGITGEIQAEDIAYALDKNPDSQAVILASPNYYGICSDIEAIAEEVLRRGKVLIVDQAHGAHLKFFDGHGFPASAEESGADLIINSTHKTLASFTQTAILNVCSDRVDLTDLEDKLQLFESSSPSYPLMASLDINARLISECGQELFDKWRENINFFYKESKKIRGLSVMQAENLDMTKINLDMSSLGLNGNTLEELLIEKGIFIELVAGNLIMCMTGIGNTREDYQRLLRALEEISRERQGSSAAAAVQPAALSKKLQWKGVPADKEMIPLEEADGRVCASSIIPYPPGIPIACPGEIIDRETIEYIMERRKAREKVIGLTEDYMIKVGKL